MVGSASSTGALQRQAKKALYLLFSLYLFCTWSLATWVGFPPSHDFSISRVRATIHARASHDH